MLILTLDMETFYDTDYTLGRGKYQHTTEHYVRSPRFEAIMMGFKIDDGKTRWVPRDKIQATLDMIPWEKTLLVCHNTAFDGLILSHHYGKVPALYADTLSMARPWFHAKPGLSLAKLSEHLGLGAKGHEVEDAKGKHFADFSPEELTRYAGYCMNDVELTYKLFKALLKMTPKSELLFIDAVLRTSVQPLLEWDQPLLMLHHRDILARKQALMDQLNGRFGADALSSNKKFQDVLLCFGGRLPRSMFGPEGEVGDGAYSHYMKVAAEKTSTDHLFDIPTKLRPATETEQKKGITGDVEVVALGKKDEGFLALQEIEDDELQAVIAARLGTKSTIAETRASRMMDAATRGPFPISLMYYGAHTGRCSGGGEKSNPQNFPKAKEVCEKDVGFLVMTPEGVKPLRQLKHKVATMEDGRAFAQRDVTNICIRHALRAPEGYRLVVADASQIEARIVAWVAGQWDLVDKFANGEDIYSDFASGVYGKPINKKEHPVERFVGKTSVLGLGFGTSAPRLQSTLAIGQGDVRCIIPLEEAERIVKFYREVKCPRIAALWKTTNRALDAAFNGQEMSFGTNGVLRTGNNCIWLPNGMALNYTDLRVGEGKYGKEYSYWGKQEGRYQWIKTYGASATENYVQALARIVVSDAWVRIRRRYPVALQVHDELVCVAPEGGAQDCLKFMLAEMSVAPEWAPGLPLAAGGGIGVSYADAK